MCLAHVLYFVFESCVQRTLQLAHSFSNRIIQHPTKLGNSRQYVENRKIKNSLLGSTCRVFFLFFHIADYPIHRSCFCNQVCRLLQHDPQLRNATLPLGPHLVPCASETFPMTKTSATKYTCAVFYFGVRGARRRQYPVKTVNNSRLKSKRSFSESALQ